MARKNIAPFLRPTRAEKWFFYSFNTATYRISYVIELTHDRKYFGFRSVRLLRKRQQWLSNAHTRFGRFSAKQLL